MTPKQILSLMEQIDCTEDEVQIKRWGKQSPLLEKYASNRRYAIFARRNGCVDAAMIREAQNDHRYAVVLCLSIAHEDR